MNGVEEIWKKDFPVRQSEEHKASRREFAKFLGCAVLAGTGLATIRTLLAAKSNLPVHPFAVAAIDEIPVGSSKLFEHQTAKTPCILIRLATDHFVAYGQNCTHLMCPVHFNSEKKQLICPCHNGFFNAVDGSVLAGPPPRPLPSYRAEIREGQIWITT